MIFDGVPKEFLRKFPERILFSNIYTNLGFVGEPGIGKTHYATNYVFQELCDSPNRKGLWITAHKLLNSVHEGLKLGLGLETVVKDYLTPDILLIDDLFASEKQMKAPGSDTLMDIISRRMNDGLKTVWTSNLSESDIIDNCDGRLASRLLSEDRGAVVIEFLARPRIDFKGNWTNSRHLYSEWTEDQIAANEFLLTLECEQYWPYSKALLFRLYNEKKNLSKKAMAIIVSKINIDKWQLLCKEIDAFIEECSKHPRKLNLNKLNRLNITEKI